MDTQITLAEKMSLAEKKIYQCVHLLKSEKNAVHKILLTKTMLASRSAVPNADLNSEDEALASIL